MESGSLEFQYDEISPGMYEVVADDQQGGAIRHVGPDPEAATG
jgi:hypothetical protein